LSAYGYAPCGPGGAIASLCGIPNIMRSELPDNAGEWRDSLLLLCDHCQYSALTKIPLAAMWDEKTRREISPFYQRALDTYHGRKRFEKW